MKKTYTIIISIIVLLVIIAGVHYAYRSNYSGAYWRHKAVTDNDPALCLKIGTPGTPSAESDACYTELSFIKGNDIESLCHQVYNEEMKDICFNGDVQKFHEKGY
jgi:hypothetical protein